MRPVANVMTRRRLMRTAVVLSAATLPPARARDVQRVRLQTNTGAIDIDLFTRQAPLSAGDFLKYIDRHFYDGGSFSRVVRPGNDHGSPHIDVIQGGIRDGVTPLPPIALETTRQTGLHHLDGTISIPRDTVGTGSGSEFFICIGAQPSLDWGGQRNKDGQGFAAFGRVVAGMDLVRKIWQMDTSGASSDPYTQGQMLQHPVRIISGSRIS